MNKLILAATLALPTAALAQPHGPVRYAGLALPELPAPSRWIEVDGVKLHYLEAGGPRGGDRLDAERVAPRGPVIA